MSMSCQKDIPPCTSQMDFILICCLRPKEVQFEYIYFVHNTSVRLLNEILKFGTCNGVFFLTLLYSYF